MRKIFVKCWIIMSVSEHGATSNTRIATNETCNITQKHAVELPVYKSTIPTYALG